MSKVTGYSYIPQFFGVDPVTNIQIEIYRPIISIRISKVHGIISLPFDALIDSGSDRNLFPLKYTVGSRVLSLLREDPKSGYFTNLREWVDYWTDGAGGKTFQKLVEE